MTETFKVIDLAHTISRMMGVAVSYLANPRKEPASNELSVENRGLIGLGLDPITLTDGLLREISDIARKYAANCDRAKIPCVSRW
jgi:UDP-sulfoquinovose synthase